MMRFAAVVLALILVGCGQPQSMLAKEEQTEPGINVAGVDDLPGYAPPPAADADLAAPQIAYRYSRRYRAPADGIAALQARHIALCDQAGRSVCHILSQRVAEAEAGQDSELALSVTAAKARTLLDSLDKAVAGEGGDVVASGIEAEDLGRQIVDVEARMRAKQALVDRLLVIIRSRTGSIKDIVAAEQAFADAQGDLESAQADLARMRREVARSTITLTYAAPAGVRSSFNETLRPAFDDAGAMLGQSLAALFRFLILGLPWLIAIGLPLNWWLRRRRARKAASDKAPHDMAAG